MNLVLCFLPCSLSSGSPAKHLKPSALVCVCMHVFVYITNTQRRKSPLHCRPEQWNPRGRLSCLSPSSAMQAMWGPNNLPKHIICHRLSMPCFAFTKYSTQYAYALQFSFASYQSASKQDICHCFALLLCAKCNQFDKESATIC